MTAPEFDVDALAARQEALAKHLAEHEVYRKHAGVGCSCRQWFTARRPSKKVYAEFYAHVAETFADPAHGLVRDEPSEDDLLPAWEHLPVDVPVRHKPSHVCRADSMKVCRYCDGEWPCAEVSHDEPSENERGRWLHTCLSAADAPNCEGCRALSDDGRTAVELTVVRFPEPTSQYEAGFNACYDALAARLRHVDGEADRGE